LRRLGKIVDDAKRALIYPVFVFMTIMLTVVFWVSYVIPNIADLFSQMQVQLPALTLWVLSASESLNQYGWEAIAVLMFLMICIYVLFKESLTFRYQVHRLLMVIPVSRTLMRSSSLAFITEYLSLLLAAGVNMVESLRVLEHAIRNEVYRESIGKMRAGTMRGNALSDEMRQTKIYPGFVVRMIFVGEQSGCLDEQLEYLAEEYQVRFEHIVSSIAEIIQLLVMLLTGALFLLMVAALFLSIYQLIGEVDNV
jgi:type IV pilus assembly protein PilC